MNGAADGSEKENEEDEILLPQGPIQGIIWRI